MLKVPWHALLEKSLLGAVRNLYLGGGGGGFILLVGSQNVEVKIKIA